MKGDVVQSCKARRWRSTNDDEGTEGSTGSESDGEGASHVWADGGSEKFIGHDEDATTSHTKLEANGCRREPLIGLDNEPA